MCGIIAVIAKHGDMEKAREAMLEQYENQYSRGTRGFGLIEVTNKGIRIRKATEPVKALLDIGRSEAPILLFHHRMPTSTDNKLDQAHPMKVSNDELKSDWYISHNGVIQNANELKKKHEEAGYTYDTIVKEKYHYENSTWQKFNDSEAFAIELVRFLEGKIEEVTWTGAAAFVGIRVNKKTQKPTQVVFGRGETNPLQMKETEDNLILASDIAGEDVFDHELKAVSFLSLKAINNPAKWPKTSNDKMPLLEMAYTNEIKIKEEPMVTHHYHAGFQDKDKIRPYGLLTAGHKDDGKASNAVIHLENIEQGPTEEETSPKQKAFYKMADKTTEKVACIINLIFENLSEGEMDDRDMQEYMNDIEGVIRERFKGAERARYHLDKQEEVQMANDLDRLPFETPTKDALDKSIDNMTESYD